MTHQRLLLSTTLALGLVATSAGRAQVPAALRTAMRDRHAAVTQADAATWDRLTADNFTVVLPNGSLLTKAERLAQLRTQQAAAPAPVENETVQTYGNVAVHRFKTGSVWVLQVWTRDQRGWRVSSVQVTTIMPASQADLDALKQVRERELAGLRSGRPEDLAAAFTSDAVLLPPGEPAVTGEAALRSWAQSIFHQNTVSAEYTSAEATVIGDWAVERYSGTLTATPKTTGAPIEDRFRGIHIYRRQPDGSWRIAQDIWNSALPPQPASGNR